MPNEPSKDAWMDDIIVYGVVPRNVGPAGFRSVTEKLTDLADLGVNMLWLSPINATPSGDFGYAVTDYFKLRPDYGTEAEFKALVQAAHSRGIRVVMDFVPNHTSAQHPYFLDAQARGPASPYYAFYDRDEHGTVTHYFDWEHLPNLNFDNPQVQEWIIDAFSYWVREFDVDGFRVDVAWGIKERKPEFWPQWRDALTAIKPDLFLLAEASARDPYYVTNGFDAAYDWTDELGHGAWERVFEDQKLIVPRLHAALTNEGRGFEADARIFRFLNNNDTGPRCITRYGLGITRVATALLLTLPGIPCIYMGDEVGAEWQPYQTSLPIAWDDQHSLRSYHQTLIGLRRQIPGLRSPHWQALDVAEAEQVYAYLRYDSPAQKSALVVLNFAGTECAPVLQFPAGFQAWADRATVQDVLADESVQLGNREALRVPMQPWSVRILSTQKP